MSHAVAQRVVSERSLDQAANHPILHEGVENCPEIHLIPKICSKLNRQANFDAVSESISIS